MQLEKSDFKKEAKKLKRYLSEQRMLEKILLHIKQSSSFEDLKRSPISKMYGFEALKHDMNGYYSFNLCKNRGTIRLICEINREQNLVKVVYISMNHYEDFKKAYKHNKSLV